MSDMSKLPFQDVVEGSTELLLRRWRVAHAKAQGSLVDDSLEHLRPWMPFIVAEPMAIEDREEMLAKWESDFDEGTKDAMYAVFSGSDLVGSCGLHRRCGPNGLEIGYWIGSAHTRKGYATELARLLTRSALTFPEIEFVEIHNDKANLASAGVPKKLGFEYVGEVAVEATAPGETGTHVRWRMTRARWNAAQQI